jgi:hypothetical protein
MPDGSHSEDCEEDRCRKDPTSKFSSAKKVYNHGWPRRSLPFPVVDNLYMKSRKHHKCLCNIVSRCTLSVMC